MPAGFDACVKNGGSVKTIVPKKGTYIHVCYLNGKSYSGEVRHTKKESRQGIIKHTISKVKK